MVAYLSSKGAQTRDKGRSMGAVVMARERARKTPAATARCDFLELGRSQPAALDPAGVAGAVGLNPGITIDH